MQSELDNVHIGFEFEFGSINGRIMCLDMSPYHPPISPNSPGRIMIGFDVQLPATINISVLGKNQFSDTLLDEQGNIINDLFVKLHNIWLDEIIVPPNNLQKIIVFYTQLGQTLNVDYWGFNGVAMLTLDQNSVFDQIMKWNRLMPEN